MVAALPADRVGELRAEKAALLKAESDIEEGWKRLRSQQDLATELRAAGHDTAQAERLVQLLRQTLIEWERHRALIEERVAYLQRQS
ncbi:MAG: hypothetical protein JOZ74_09760 [Bradyrhizobium sp.]|nr:hypothetical protein [Bradyrhizobium sp.]